MPFHLSCINYIIARLFKKYIYCLLLILLPGPCTYAQVDTATATDSLVPHRLQEVMVNAYEHENEIINTPTAVANISAADLNRFNNSSILQAVNNVPGVRMEERSPGSYRFGIRGSAANAPFGVRNVKVYYNGIPFTDAGGNTYLNQLGQYNFHSLEIIREPGSSVYGAGTGGVILINSVPDNWKRSVRLNYTTGSFGMHNIAAEVTAGTQEFQNTIRYQRLQGAGYREHSALKREVLSWDGLLNHGEKFTLGTHLLYSAVQYETPGGLTAQQYAENAAQARPTEGSVPGAAQNRAAVNQHMLLGGITGTYTFSKKWQHYTTIFARQTLLDNPTLRNYSKVAQPGMGGRTVLKYHAMHGGVQWQWLLGLEGQQGYSYEKTYRNNGGMADTLQQEVRVSNTQLTGFTQLTATWHRLTATAGLSLSDLYVRVHTLYPAQAMLRRHYSNQLAPRVALLYKVAPAVTIYTSLSKGFSPPTTEELAPTGGVVNTALNPATAMNYQVGTKGYLLKHRLYYDVTAFYMTLQNMVVPRRDAAGGDYYINAGSTVQRGAEVMARYIAYRSPYSVFRNVELFASYTGYDFRYRQFARLMDDYSGNKLPGVPATAIAAGCNIITAIGVYINANGYYNDVLPLNDANTVYDKPYLLADARAGWTFSYKKHMIDIFSGVNNIFNARYSLGNDINAFGGRYYNSAPPVNYYVGLSLHIGY